MSTPLIPCAPPLGAPGTLGNLVGKYWVNIHCDGRDQYDNVVCNYSKKFDPADLADRFGLDYRWDRLLARMKCAKCGSRSATAHIQPPYMPDGSDRPRAWTGRTP